jgi:hypothetical protein
MSKLMIVTCRIGFYLYFFSVISLLSCLPNEEKWKEGGQSYEGLTCVPELPDGFACLGTPVGWVVTRHDLEEAWGVWYYPTENFCYEFFPNGKGLLHSISSGQQDSIRWGCHVDSKGNNINGEANKWDLYVSDYTSGYSYASINFNQENQMLGYSGYRHVIECGSQLLLNTYGTLTVYADDVSDLPIQVVVNGTTKWITEANSGCAVFYLPAGTYSVSATNDCCYWPNIPVQVVTVGGCAFAGLG